MRMRARVCTHDTHVSCCTRVHRRARLCARARLSKLQSIVYVIFEDGGCGDAYVAYVAAREYRNEVSYFRQSIEKQCRGINPKKRGSEDTWLARD